VGIMTYSIDTPYHASSSRSAASCPILLVSLSIEMRYQHIELPRLRHFADAV
jgi:hypothetical protein